MPTAQPTPGNIRYDYSQIGQLFLAFCFFMLMALFSGKAQGQAYGPKPSLSSSEIAKELDRMQTLGSVLYMAAHPDDENTRLITYFAKGQGLETAYLSLTRGDGGQNLIGKEVRELLGIIRTQELLAARRTDGGQQIFSRANDFGFSKIPAETLTIWDSTQVLADAVWAIRKFRPDVILTRFSPNRPGLTHGHHTTSALMAEAAFNMAADPKAFPEQLDWVEPWQAERLFWNTSWWFFRSNPDTLKQMNLLTTDMGGYDPLLGKSYGTIASQSRSMHKSQGFGAAADRGASTEYFLQLAGTPAKKDIVEGIDMDWSRVEGSETVAQLLKQAAESFDHRNPHLIMPKLAEAYRAIGNLPASNHWVKVKKEQLGQLMLQCAGIWAEATTSDYRYVPGDSLYLSIRAIRRSPVQVVLGNADLDLVAQTYDSTLRFNQVTSIGQKLKIPSDLPISHPYWLRDEPSLGMFRVADQPLIGLPENKPALSAKVRFRFPDLDDLELEQVLPFMYRWVDPVEGERYRPLELAPAVTLNVETPNLVFAYELPKKLKVTAKAHTEKAKGKIVPKLPKGWGVSPAEQPFYISEKYGEEVFYFEVRPPKDASVDELGLVAEMEDGSTYNNGLTSISYPHIPIQTLFPKVRTRLIRINMAKGGQRIGYVEGAGDAVPEALREVGYQVDLLDVAELDAEKLRAYDAIMVGVRAYNVNERLKFGQKALLDYVYAGGTLILQYNTTSRLVTDQLGPFNLKISRDRVTVEEAPVTFLRPGHPVLNQPNKIVQADMDNWVQERGLYFPDEWDDAYEPIFSMNDPGEEPKQGSLLVADHGKGTYIYTGLSFFRELPAGVPGAYRLLANLLAYKQIPKTDKKPQFSNPDMPKQ